MNDFFGSFLEESASRWFIFILLVLLAIMFWGTIIKMISEA